MKVIANWFKRASLLSSTLTLPQGTRHGKCARNQRKMKDFDSGCDRGLAVQRCNASRDITALFIFMTTLLSKHPGWFLKAFNALPQEVGSRPVLLTWIGR